MNKIIRNAVIHVMKMRNVALTFVLYLKLLFKPPSWMLGERKIWEWKIGLILLLFDWHRQRGMSNMSYTQQSNIVWNFKNSCHLNRTVTYLSTKDTTNSSKQTHCFALMNFTISEMTQFHMRLIHLSFSQFSFVFSPST